MKEYSHHSALCVEKVPVIPFVWHHKGDNPFLTPEELNKYATILDEWLQDLFNVEDDEWPDFKKDLFAMHGMPSVFELCLQLKKGVEKGQTIEEQRDKFEKIFMISMVR